MNWINWIDCIDIFLWNFEKTQEKLNLFIV